MKKTSTFKGNWLGKYIFPVRGAYMGRYVDVGMFFFLVGAGGF